MNEMLFGDTAKARRTKRTLRKALCCSATALALAAGQSDHATAGTLTGARDEAVQIAQSTETHVFDIPAQPLGGALADFGRQAGIQITLNSEILEGRDGPAVTGSMTAEQALQRLLSGSGINWRFLEDGTVALERPATEKGTAVLDPVRVVTSVAPSTSSLGNKPEKYAGGQVATGGKLGVLGNQDAMDVPFSITSYTEETIDNQQAETISDVMANDPSVRSGYAFGNYQELFVIRGFPLSGEDIAIDGMYGNAPRQIVSMEMFDRVEVLKGANAFLNGVAPGNTGIGGGINLVPKRAGDTPLTRFTARYEQTARLGGHADVSRRFGDDNAFGIRVNAAVRDGETAIDNEQRYMHLGHVALDYDGERARATLDLATQRHRIDQGKSIVRVNTTTVPDATAGSSNYAPGFVFSEMRDSYAQLSGEYDILPALTAHATVGYRDLREDGDFATPTVINAAGDATISSLIVPREDTNQSGQVGIRGDYATGPVRHQFGFGYAALKTINRNSFDFSNTVTTNIFNPVDFDRPATSFSGGDFNDLPKVSESTLQSYYVSDTLSFWEEKVALTVGLRYQHIHSENFNRDTFVETQNIAQSATTPVVGLVVHPMQSLALYANRIEGLSVGEVAPGGAANAGEIFPPFQSVQWELGAKWDQGNFGAGVAVFQTTQPSGITDPATNIFGVDGEQENRGVEVTMFGEPWKGIRLLGGVTYTQAELQNTAGGTNDGNDAVGVPRVQANLGMEWDLPFLNRTTVSARTLITGDQQLNAANTLEVDGWARLDVGARTVQDIYGRDVAFRLNIENLTNHDYWASAQGGYLTPGAPLTAKLSVSADF